MKDYDELERLREENADLQFSLQAAKQLLHWNDLVKTAYHDYFDYLVKNCKNKTWQQSEQVYKNALDMLKTKMKYLLDTFDDVCPKKEV